MSNNNEKSSITTVRRMCETAIMIALATGLSYITIFKAPMGGSITLVSQLPIVIIGYRYGVKWGAFTGVIYGVLQMLLQGLENFSYVKGIGAYLILILFDYVLAFAALGIGGGLFKKSIKNQPLAIGLGAGVASLLRFICHFISGVTIWGQWAPKGTPVWIYSLTYNGAYMLIECVMTVVVAALMATVLDFTAVNLRKKKKANA